MTELEVLGEVLGVDVGALRVVERARDGGLADAHGGEVSPWYEPTLNVRGSQPMSERETLLGANL